MSDVTAGMDTVRWRCRECGAPNGVCVACRECGAGVPSALPVRIVTSLRVARPSSTIRPPPLRAEAVQIPDADFEDVPPPSPRRRRRSVAATVGSLMMALMALIVTSAFVFFVAIAYVAFAR